MTTTPFNHSPLDPADQRAIQILELLPSRDLQGPIRCELHHHSLDQDVQYEALSYAWGDPEPGHTVFVNGPHTLDVTSNCLQALMCLRRRFHRRSLWVDAICIDQREDDASKRERAHQVKIMGDIYGKAQKVLVWLGPSEPSTARTISRLKLIAKVKAVRESTNLGYSALRSFGKYLSRRMIEQGRFDAAPQPRYQAFASMIRSPWWQRVWTLQEQVLARQCEVYHGRQSLPISSLQPNPLTATVEFLTNGDGSYNHAARHNIRVSCQRYNAIQQGSPDSSLLNFDFVAKLSLEVAFLLEAKHPIDKVYGLYSILTIYCNLPLPAPDYNKTAEDVYEEMIWSWIKTRGDLSILKLATRPGCVHKLPSWVPAWHQQHPGYVRNIGPASSTPERLRMLRKSHFNWNYSHAMSPLFPEIYSDPSGETKHPASVAEVVSPGKLRVLHARSAGRVSHALGPDRSNEIKWYYTSVECLYVHLDWCRLFREVFFHSATEREEALQEMFRSLLCPGIHQFRPESKGDEDQERWFESFRAWFDFLSCLNDAFGSPTPPCSEMSDAERSRESGVKLYFDVCAAHQEEEATNVLESRYGGHVQGREGLAKLARHIRSTKRDLDLMRNHSLCILDKDNMIAVTDYWCQEGDEVFVFPGTDSPFVLRKQPDGDCYRLIGPALVDRLFRVGYQKWRSEGDDLQDIVLI